MLKIHIKSKILIILTVLILLSSCIIASGFTNRDYTFKETGYEYSYDQLDLKYIYNITENLSNIIFTEYEDGEIAKGRAYGTKGEHRAADILLENMTKLGLNAYKEQINNTDKYPQLTHELEVVDLLCKN